MPRVYVACLASYNNGVLHGKWIDADQCADAIAEEVQEMLRESRFPDVTVTCPICNRECLEAGFEACTHCNNTGEVPSAEEHAIHDYEGFEGIKLSESEDFETVAHHAEMLEEHGAAWAAFVDWTGEDSEARFQDLYLGQFDSMTAYAEEYVESTGMLQGVDETVRRYFDYEAFGRDLELGGDVVEHNGYYFNGNY